MCHFYSMLMVPNTRLESKKIRERPIRTSNIGLLYGPDTDSAVDVTWLPGVSIVLVSLPLAQPTILHYCSTVDRVKRARHAFDLCVRRQGASDDGMSEEGQIKCKPQSGGHA